ncbi:Hypothetical protein HVR_LOCUS1242 [uncultured virus]|nr:Hypothetical protein HVR_LOCUS1242 [uncultured virus]
MTDTYSDDDILNGNVDPDLCFEFKGTILEIEKSFSYPIDSFGIDGSWDYNGSKDITSGNIEFFKKLILSKYDKVYYMQEGEGDGDSWIICAKVDKLYIYFEASCDYTGFDCRGGGTFAYSTNWNELWNKHMTQEFRNLLSSKNNYPSFKLNYAQSVFHPSSGIS